MVLQSASEVQEHMGDIPSKDLADTNCSHMEPFPEQNKPSPRTVLKWSSFPEAWQGILCEEPDFVELDFVESFCDNPLHIMLSTASQSSTGEETDFVELFCDNPIHKIVSKKNSLIKDREKTSGVYEENRTFSTVKISNVAIPPEETDVIQPSVSEETGSTEVIQSAISEETRLNNTIQSKLDSSESRTKIGLVSSSGTKKVQIPPNVINTSAVRKVSSERFSENAVHLLNSEKYPDSSRVAAEDMNIFTLLQDIDEFKNGTHFIVSGTDCGSHVAASSITPCEPIFPNFEMPSVSLPTKVSTMSSLKPLNPANDSAVPKDISSKTSLSTLLSIFTDWVYPGMDKTYNRSDMNNVEDLLDYAKVESAYGLDVLKYMQKRIDTLLRAAASIPNPPYNMLRGLNGERNFFRDGLNDAGTKVLRRLEALESEITENFKVCRFDSELNDESDVRVLQAWTWKFFCVLFVKTWADHSKLNLEIENFRNRIRDFCTDIDNFL